MSKDLLWHNKKSWSNGEDQLLQAKFNLSSLSEVARLLNRTEDACLNRAKKLGLYINENTYLKWKDEEKYDLFTHINEPLALLKERFSHRTYEAIYKKRKQILREKYHKRELMEELLFIAHNLTCSTINQNTSQENKWAKVEEILSELKSLITTKEKQDAPNSHPISHQPPAAPSANS